MALPGAAAAIPRRWDGLGDHAAPRLDNGIATEASPTMDAGYLFSLNPESLRTQSAPPSSPSPASSSLELLSLLPICNRLVSSELGIYSYLVADCFRASENLGSSSGPISY